MVYAIAEGADIRRQSPMLQPTVEDNAFHLPFAWQRLTHEIADEAPDDDVLP
jgi:hypothetical protein